MNEYIIGLFLGFHAKLIVEANSLVEAVQIAPDLVRFPDNSIPVLGSNVQELYFVDDVELDVEGAKLYNEERYPAEAATFEAPGHLSTDFTNRVRTLHHDLNWSIRKLVAPHAPVKMVQPASFDKVSFIRVTEHSVELIKLTGEVIEPSIDEKIQLLADLENGKFIHFPHI